MGLHGWGWDDVLPHFKRPEDYVDGPSEMHGAGGEWRVENQRLHWQVLDHWMEAAAAWGLPKVSDFNTGDNHGVGHFRVNQRAGWRINTAGAIDSPQILQLSGLGPGALLQRHGVEVRRDIPGIGANLQDHLQLRCAWRLTGAMTLNTLANSLWGKAKIALEYAVRRTGPMSMAPSQLGAFSKSRPDLATPDLEYHVQPLTLEAFGQPLHDFPGLTASVCNLRPESRGSGEWAKLGGLVVLRWAFCKESCHGCPDNCRDHF